LIKHVLPEKQGFQTIGDLNVLIAYQVKELFKKNTPATYLL